MSGENVEIVRQAYAVYNAAFSGPNPRKAILAWLERFYDPEAEWDFDPTVAIEQQIYRGIDEVITFFDQVLEA